MEFKEPTKEENVASQAIKYGAWLLGLVIVLYFMSRHVFPFIKQLF